MGEPMKLTFGFSKISKKTALVPQKPIDSIEYIKCVEDNTVKLVNEVKPKPLPVIPMPPGSSVRDRILDAIKTRDEARGKQSQDNGAVEVVNNDGNETKKLTLEEMATKELMEGGKLVDEEKKANLVITATVEATNREISTLDDYDNMPINDFGLAMLRGMGWEPTKGIGLNEKVVSPAEPQVRPKGMGLGADRALAAQKSSGKTATDLVLKKGSPVKVISGPHNQLYGKIEAFEELPGRILVRLSLSNVVVSLSEFMVQAVNAGEFNKNAKVMNLGQYNAEVEIDAKPSVKTEASAPVTYERRRSRSPAEKYSSRKYEKNRDYRISKKHKHVNRDSSDSDSTDKRRRNDSRDHHRRRDQKSKYDSSSDSDYREKKRRDKSQYKKKNVKDERDRDSTRDRYGDRREKLRK